MKKFMTAIIAVAMMASLFIPQVSAASERQFVQVLQATEGQITIDGQITTAEWDDNNKLVLKAGDTASPTTLTSWVYEKVDDIEFYYSWTKDGIYMAAKTIDDNVTPIYANDEAGATRSGDTFQIAFNPAGLIADDFQGLFFSFLPIAMAEGATSGDVMAIKHNWEWGTPDPDGTLNTDNATRFDTSDEKFQGAWIKTATGWDVEIFLPINYLASEDRKYDLDVADNSQYNLKDCFKPEDPEARKYAFATAMIAYCDYEVVTPATDAEGTGYEVKIIGTGRTTFPETKDDQFWTVDGYPLCLKFNLTGETANQDTETWAPTEVTVDGGDITDPAVTNAPGAEETKKPTDDTTKAPASADTTAGTTSGNDDEGAPVGLIIGIVAAVVVVAGAVVFVVLKKKKN